MTNRDQRANDRTQRRPADGPSLLRLLAATLVGALVLFGLNLLRQHSLSDAAWQGALFSVIGGTATWGYRKWQDKGSQ